MQSLRPHHTCELVEPVLNENQGRTLRLGVALFHHEKAAISRDVVRAADTRARTVIVAILEQLHGIARAPRSCVFYVSAHHGATRRQKHELVTSSRPERLDTPVSGDLPLAGLDTRERPHVDFESAGCIRLVREP